MAMFEGRVVVPSVQVAKDVKFIFHARLKNVQVLGGAQTGTRAARMSEPRQHGLGWAAVKPRAAAHGAGTTLFPKELQRRLLESRRRFPAAGRIMRTGLAKPDSHTSGENLSSKFIVFRANYWLVPHSPPRLSPSPTPSITSGRDSAKFCVRFTYSTSAMLISVSDSVIMLILPGTMASVA